MEKQKVIVDPDKRDDRGIVYCPFTDLEDGSCRLRPALKSTLSALQCFFSGDNGQPCPLKAGVVEVCLAPIRFEETKDSKPKTQNIQYPPDFKPDCNITYDGKEGWAKLTLPALGEMMRTLAAQAGSPPRAFTMPIDLKVQDVPLTNTIWISPDIAAAIEEHMKQQKQKNKKDS